MSFGPPPVVACRGGSSVGLPPGFEPRADAPPAPRSDRRAFTLIEMLVVMGIVLAVTMLVTPAFTQMNAARAINKASYDIAGLLEEARAYAKANNTYTWVGFYEEGYNQSAGTAGTGRVIVSAVASKNGTAMYGVTDSNPPALTTLGTPAVYNLVQLGNLVKIDNVHLALLNPTTGDATTDEVPLRLKEPDPQSTSTTPSMINVPAAYQVGDQTTSTPPQSAAFAQRSTGANITTFNYPLYTTGANSIYTFYKIIQFNPMGDATKIVDTPQRLIEIGLRPTHGTVVDTSTKNLAAIQVSGIGGAVRIFRQ